MSQDISVELRVQRNTYRVQSACDITVLLLILGSKGKLTKSTAKKAT